MSRQQSSNQYVAPWNRQFRFTGGSGTTNINSNGVPAGGAARPAAATIRHPAPASTEPSTNQVKKKTPEELFREAKARAKQWATQRQASPDPAHNAAQAPPHASDETASPPVVETQSVDISVNAPYRRDNDTLPHWSTAQSSRNVPADNRLASAPAYRNVVPPAREAQQHSAPEVRSQLQQERNRPPPPSPTFGVSNLQSPIVHNYAEDVAGPFSPGPLRTSVGSHNRSDLHTPFRAFRDAGLASTSQAPPLTTPEPARENGNRAIEPNKPLEVPESLDYTNRTYTQWMLDITGVSTLKQYERILLLVLLVASPVLVYLCERTLLAWVPLAPSNTNGSVAIAEHRLSQYLATVKAYFGTMTTLDVVASIMLGVSLSLTFDRDTASTDAHISRTVGSMVDAFNNAVTTLRSSVGMKNVRSKDSGAQSTSSPNESDGSKPPFSPFVKVVTRILRLPQRIPLLVRFLIAIFVFGLASRVVVGKVATIVVAKTSPYWSSALWAVVGVVCVYVLFIGLRYYYQRVSTRRRVVGILASFAKALLLHRSGPCSIAYLYEEIAETVQVYTRGGVSSGLFSPLDGGKTSQFASASKPAVVVSTSNGFLGAVRSVFNTVSGLAGGGGEVSSPSKLNTVDKVDLLQQAIDLHSPRRDSSTRVNASGSGAFPDEAAGSRDVMRGYKLKTLWTEVEKAVQSDRRVQRVELIMDGRKQSCWRVLVGSTQAKI